MASPIILRDFIDNDMDLFKEWLYIPHVAAWFHDPLDWSVEAEKRDSEYQWLHHFLMESDGEPIGFCQYYACRYSGEPWPE